MATTEFKVSGLSCQHCVAKVKNALESIDKVDNVSVSLQDQTVKLEAEPMPSIENLNQVLEDYGNYSLSV